LSQKIFFLEPFLHQYFVFFAPIFKKWCKTFGDKIDVKKEDPIFHYYIVYKLSFKNFLHQYFVFLHQFSKNGVKHLGTKLM